MNDEKIVPFGAAVAEITTLDVDIVIELADEPHWNDDDFEAVYQTKDGRWQHKTFETEDEYKKFKMVVRLAGKWITNA